MADGVDPVREYVRFVVRSRGWSNDPVSRCVQQPLSSGVNSVSEEQQENQPPAQQSSPTQEIAVNDADVHAVYANFCRVVSTPEELILDLGLNPNPYATGTVNVKVSQRVIMNYFSAKRMLSALATALGRHEQTFGTLETDVRKRVRTDDGTRA